MNENQQADIVIITALDKERDTVRCYLDKSQQIQQDVFDLQHDNAESYYRVALVGVGKMGSVAAGIATTTAIAGFNPSIVILVGIMGGVKGDNRHLGDLIVADQIVGYEQGKITDTGTERRYEVQRPDNELLEATRNFSVTMSPIIARPDGQNATPKVHWGLVASGEKVIADSKTIPALQDSWSRVIGVEMEGYGVALAAYKAKSRPRFLMVKSICDWANSEKNDDWQEYAADVAAGFVVSFLRSKPIDIKPHEPTKQTKLFPEILFYSANRTCQKKELKQVITTYQKQYSDKKQRPILCLVHGNKNEYGNFFKYLLDYYLPKDNNFSRYFSSGICDIQISFQEEFYKEKFHTIGKLHKEILACFKDVINTDEKEIIAKRLARERRPIVIYARLSIEDFNWQDEKTIVDGFIDFWADWPEKIYAQQQLFLVFLSISYENNKSVPILHKLFSRKNTNKLLLNQFEVLSNDYPTIIDFFKKKNVHAKVFSKLDSVIRSSACNWATDCKDLQKLHSDTYILEKKIDALYNDKNAIPMDDLVIELKKLLTNPNG
ncbi:5'-methylthioadenosine/S-adenosylhomocysteine nucleosidase [Candidatus Halobeggiatoa sp. HSG11]|nr:5'-methylthioadenosine/S-adenosylhomocysteine nucleosidase [Candidatus Halobeggiatoa sp. HSG11]